MTPGRRMTSLLARSGSGTEYCPDSTAPQELPASLLRDAIARLVPGTQLRDGIDRILWAGTGGLIVLGYDERVESLCDGGFELDTEFAPTRLRELSKMDGAVVLSIDGSRIVRANAHLVPDPRLPTMESGTRHRAAERTAAQTGYPVVSVSRSTSIITVYVNGTRHLIRNSSAILSRADQALATLERYKYRLDEVIRQLSALEIEDFATLRDVLTVVHCLELMRRIAREIDQDVLELGVDGRQLALQLTELVGNIDTMRRLLVRDYLVVEKVGDVQLDRALTMLDGLLEVELLELANLAPPLGYPAVIEVLDTAVSPRGYRLLADIPRVPFRHTESVVRAFGTLRALLVTSVEELGAVNGITPQLACRIRDGLSRVAEAG